MKALTPLLLTLLLPLAGIASPAVPLNPTQLENEKPGDWDWELTDPAVSREIEGYASATSVNRGESIRLFVSTSAPGYRIEVFRMGWYGGAGARRVFGPTAELPGIRQAEPPVDPETGLVECDWRDPFVLSTRAGDPSGWASGYYLARLTASTGKQSFVLFVVRDDERASTYLFQSSVTTFQAYNNWGGKSLYGFNSADGVAATKVSFNRPYGLGYNPQSKWGLGAGEFLTNVQPENQTPVSAWEYNLVRFLEKEGYDVAYSTNIDTHRDPARLLRHQAFLSVGHDEYWSRAMREHVTLARDLGVHLAFFSANTCYWQIRLEPSSLDRAQADRTVVSYRTTYADPVKGAEATVKFRELGWPEDALLGVMYIYNPVQDDVIVENTSHWIFEGTGLRDGDRIRGLIGYEVDGIWGNGVPRQVRLAHTTVPIASLPSQSVDMSIYTADSGALVFATGSMQWSWGLDDYGAPRLRGSYQSPQAIRMTRNLLDRMALGPRGLPARRERIQPRDPGGRRIDFQQRVERGPLSE